MQESRENLIKSLESLKFFLQNNDVKCGKDKNKSLQDDDILDSIKK